MPLNWTERSVFHFCCRRFRRPWIALHCLSLGQESQAVEPAYRAKDEDNRAGLFMRAPDKDYIPSSGCPGRASVRTVYHEYTHFMLRNATEWLPLWLNEGLAEFYQNTDIQEKDVLLGQANSDDILYLRQNRLLPLTTLLKVDSTSPDYHQEQKASVFYAESWALTHYLEITDRQKGTDRLQDYANFLVKKEDRVVACAAGLRRSEPVTERPA